MEILLKKIENGEIGYVKQFFSLNKSIEDIILRNGLKICIENKHYDVSL